MSQDHHWIDDELRRVPLPPGLLARLRAVGELTDDQLDALVRGVVVPEMLLEQLQTIPADEAIEVRLGDVTIPAGLLAELAFIPQDEQLRDVEVPAGLLDELQKITPAPRRQMALVAMSLVASLLALLLGGYLLVAAGWGDSALHQVRDTYASVFGVQVHLPVPPEPVTKPPVDLIAEGVPPAPSEPMVAVEDVLQPVPKLPTMRQELEDLLPPGYQLTDSYISLKYGILGQAQSADDRTPDLDLLVAPTPRGLEPPVAPGFDRQFLITKRTQPVVSLEALKKLGSDAHVSALIDQLSQNRLPLWTQTTGFDRLRQLVAQGRLPEASEIHAEDFLAAMDYQYGAVQAVEPGQLGIRTYGGPSPFGDAGAKLLQIGVQAGPVKRTAEPVHVTLVIDISDSMRFEDRLDAVRQGVAALARQLSPGDHISLIAFNDSAELLLEDSPAEDRDALTEALDALAPHGGTNIGPALAHAATAAASFSAMQHPRRRVAVISEGVPLLGETAVAKIHLLLTEMQRGGAAIDVIELGDGASPSEGLAQLSAAAGTKLLNAGDSTALSRRLVEQLLGVSPVVADYASVRVKFNPAVVKAYRLIGHETTTAGGLLPASIESTLLGAEAATALYEVWFYDDAPNHVATVEVRWRNAAGEEMPPVTYNVTRVEQFKPSFAESAIQLQAAAIAAEAAEVLRLSPFAPPRSRSLAAVLAQAKDVNPLLQQRPSYQRFLRVLRDANTIRP